jgi:hypothetical protein
MAKLKIKKFANKEDQDAWLIKNQDLLKAQRRSVPKFTDAHSYGFTSFAVNDRGEKLKAEDISNDPNIDNGVLKVKCIINATNILDSHRDLHLPGIWKKSLSEKKLIYLCQEHDLSFKGIISDEVKAYTQTFTFKELGFTYDGNTECLVFDAVIHKDRNKFMYNQYLKGYVRNHSVRMEYVKEYFCMDNDSSEATQYKENWDKYAPLVANQECLDTVNWFYAVTEAKVRDEGSAVVKGSCTVTPTLEVTTENKNQAGDNPLDNTREPSTADTQTKKKVFIY